MEGERGREGGWRVREGGREDEGGEREREREGPREVWMEGGRGGREGGKEGMEGGGGMQRREWSTSLAVTLVHSVLSTMVVVLCSNHLHATVFEIAPILYNESIGVHKPSL